MTFRLGGLQPAGRRGLFSAEILAEVVAARGAPREYRANRMPKTGKWGKEESEPFLEGFGNHFPRQGFLQSFHDRVLRQRFFKRFHKCSFQFVHDRVLPTQELSYRTYFLNDKDTSPQKNSNAIQKYIEIQYCAFKQLPID